MRPADEHLNPQEFEMLLFGAVDSGHNNVDSVLRKQAEQHLNGCAVCRSMAERYRDAEKILETLESGHRASRNKDQALTRGPDCPADEAWFHLAAGLVQEDEAERNVKHAVTCDRCGPLLKEAMEDLRQEMTLEEQKAFSVLHAPSSNWQAGMAGQLAEQSSDSTSVLKVAGREKNRKSGVWGWPLGWAWASGLVVAIIATWTGIRLTRTPDVNGLLAQAYTKSRTIEMRMPGAAYAPMQSERGSTNRDLPAEFYRAEDIIKTQFASHPQDPAWLQAQARADLLQWRYDAALKELDNGLMLRPNDPGLLLDKAIALFERAQDADPNASIDYGEAVEDLAEVLKKDPDNTVALFNRAILYERLNLPNEAIKDLERYLQKDQQGAWANDARQRLERLKKMIQAHDQALQDPLAGPAMFVRRMGEPGGMDQLNKRIEEYQELAIQEWLPLFFSPGVDQDARRTLLSALHKLGATLSERHQDHWMNDILLSADTPERYQASLLLRKAVVLAPGDAMGAYTAAGSAARLFQLAHNQAGFLRARVEQVHALQRAQQGARCLEESRRLVSRLSDLKYPWIRIQLQIDSCGCSSKVGDFEGAMAFIAAADQEAHAAQYQLLELRSLGLSAAVEVRKGNVASGWRANQQGLADYWAQPYIVPLRAQQFYDALVFAAEDLGYYDLAKAFAAEDVRAAAASNYPSIEALTRSHLGKLEMGIGELNEAATQLNLAHQTLSSLPPTLATRAYVADAEIDLAELEVLHGEMGKARERLDALKPFLKDIASFPIPLRFYQIYAKVLAGEQDIGAAETAYEQAKEIAVLNLSQLANSFDRYSWMQETSGLFRDYVQFELLAGRENDALAIWEWYRAAALNKHDSLLPPVSKLQQVLPRLKDQTVLSYALLPRGLVIWVFDERGIYSTFIEIKHADLLARTRTFLRNCGDPQSPIQILEEQSHTLYRMFIAPHKSRLVSGRLLAIEADEEMGDVPFQAFLDPDGSYISDVYPIIYSRGVFLQPEADAETEVNNANNVLVVASSAVLPGSMDESGIGSDVETEAESVAGSFSKKWVLSNPDATVQNVEALLPEAEIFHYAGHAVATMREEGLVLLNPQQKPIVWSADSDPRLFRKCRLVVLAACSTGTSRRGLKETHGRLVHTIISSGVPHVVASQWNVSSPVTAEYMRLFYLTLLRNRNIVAAINAARSGVRANPSHAHPYYWAAFAVFGHGKTT